MTNPLLRVEGLSKTFSVRGSTRRRRIELRAVDGVDISVHAGETVGLVGESGSGKSTVANLVAGLLDPTDGKILFDGTNLTTLTRKQRRRVGSQIQMVFQDPYSSLAPLSTIGASIREPLQAHGYPGSHAERVTEVLEVVGLDPRAAERYPQEFSGGQLQRVNIARALALSPSLILLDEAVSALDVSTKAQIINLLADLQSELNLAYLFISHDLSTLRYLSDQIAVMYLGRVVEQGPAEAIYTNPRHPYTRALLSAIPIPDPEAQRGRESVVLVGDVPSPIDIPSGCRFRTRCPNAMSVCAEVDPQPVEISGVTVACHLFTAEPALRS